MFTIDEIYGMSFKEFCRQTYTTPDLFINAIKAEIEILEQNYEKQRAKFNEMLLNDKNRDRQEQLILEIQKRLKKKKSKLKKYERIKNGEKI